ncbi:MAG: hypothetical protein JST84_27670 [Acidobacteria bacterium]|nr:hypothetical protein [Acidobacteriota bacterium]
MSEANPRCACAKFQRLEGSATQAYVTQFLDKTGMDDEVVYYQCRECNTRWKKIEESRRPSLVQINPE